MWIFEILYKNLINLIQKKSNKELTNIETEQCNHIFLPIDSTKKILACSKCGILIKAENLKQKPQNTVFDNTDF